MAWFKPKYSKQEVSQRFNLKELLGREPTDLEKSQFIDLAVQKIVDRTQSGKPLGGHGNRFRRYSDKYAEDKGVSPSDVDLTLFGSMLNSINGDNQTRNTVKVAIGSGVDTLKAFNHNTGDTLPKRTFFGISKKEAQEIANQVREGGLPSRQTNRTVADLLEEVGGLTFERVDDES